MIVKVNELEVNIEESTAFKLRDKIKPGADVVIVNGYPIDSDINLKENDKVTFIKKGEIPSNEELEALMVSRHSPNVFEILKKGRVAIAGVGGLGSNIAVSLARIGVGYLKLIDFDVVEPSNLNRQQYFIKQIGMNKVEACRDILREINPFMKISTINEKINSNNVDSLFQDVDIIVEAFDNPKNKAMLVNAILTGFKDKKIVSASGMAGYYSSNIIKTRKVNSRLYIAGDFVNEAKEFQGLMAPRVAIAANHQANMVVRLLLNIQEV